MRKLLTLALAAALLPAAAFGQAGIQLGAGQVFGNSTAARAPAKAENVTAILDRALGSTRGAILERGVSGWGIVGPSATAGLAWISSGTGADPVYGVVGLAGGGCNAALTASNGGILYSTASACAVLAGTATARQMLQSGASAAPAWSTATWPATTTINRILYSSAANVIGEITTANSSVLVTSAGGVPSLSTTLPSGLSSGNLALGGATIGANAFAVNGTSLFGSAVTISTSSAAALSVGNTGATNPALVVDASTASSVTGLSVKSAAAGGRIALAAISSAANEIMEIDAKGTGSVVIGSHSTGPVNIGASGGGVVIASPLSGSAFGAGVASLLANAVSAASGPTQTIASGSTALGTSAISSGTCATAVTATATNTATTDVLLAGFNGDPTAVTGYIPSTAGMLTVITYPTANTANFKVCNNTGASITPGAITLNWRVVR